jgi:hypothetical protein
MGKYDEIHIAVNLSHYVFMAGLVVSAAAPASDSFDCLRAVSIVFHTLASRFHHSVSGIHPKFKPERNAAASRGDRFIDIL